MLSKVGIILLLVGLSGLIRERGRVGGDRVSIPTESSIGS